jgi:hypothetical protein
MRLVLEQTAVSVQTTWCPPHGVIPGTWLAWCSAAEQTAAEHGTTRRRATAFALRALADKILAANPSALPCPHCANPLDQDADTGVLTCPLCD